MRLKSVYLDLDGVLINFVEGALAQWDIHEIDGTPAWQHVNSWNGITSLIRETNNIELTETEFWAKIDEVGQEFWANLNWTPWGKDLFALIQKYSDDIVLMTTPSRDPSSSAGKVEWINREMPEKQRRKYALTPCKHLMAHRAAMLIDDSPENTKKFSKNRGIVYNWPMPWNDPEWYARDRFKELEKILISVHDPEYWIIFA